MKTDTIDVCLADQRDPQFYFYSRSTSTESLQEPFRRLRLLLIEKARIYPKTGVESVLAVSGRVYRA